jgi:GAF domain-containing protein
LIGPRPAAPSLDERDLLGLFAGQAAAALDLFEAVRRVGGALEGCGELASVARLAAALEGMQTDRRDAASALLSALEGVFAASS